MLFIKCLLVYYFCTIITLYELNINMIKLVIYKNSTKKFISSKNQSLTLLRTYL